MNTEFLKSKGPSAISRVLGVSRPTATNYIKGKPCITVDQAMKLAQFYSVSLSAIIDPGQEDQITALTEENRQLNAKLSTIQSLLQNTYKNVENLIGNPETTSKKENLLKR